MRDQFPFLGIPTPARRAIDRRVTAGRQPPSEAELANFANACCARQAGNREFFVRKAIGWALREYSKTDERAVRRFVKQHGRELSALSRTEALKWLSRQGRS